MKKQRFTLVELLAVIAIAGILLAIAVPAFRSLTSGNAPDRAAREIMGRIRATRAYAASRKVDTALIFAANETNIPNSMRYSAYRSCEVYSEVTAGSTQWRFSRWIKGDQWTPIPEGIMVGLPRSTSGGDNRLLQTPRSGTLTGTVIPYNALSEESAPANGAGAGTPSAVSVLNCLLDDLPGVSAGTTVTMTNAMIFHPNGTLENSCLIELREAVHDEGNIRSVSSESSGTYFPLAVRKSGKCVYYPEKKNY